MPTNGTVLVYMHYSITDKTVLPQLSMYMYQHIVQVRRLLYNVFHSQRPLTSEQGEGMTLI